MAVDGVVRPGWRRGGGLYEPLEKQRSSLVVDEVISSTGPAGITRPRLLDKQHQHTGIDRFGVPLRNAILYWSDLFHTLLNMPRHRFVFIFFAMYVLEYIAFALLYMALPAGCIRGVNAFPSALWFSLQTASTIGYGADFSPSPACPAANVAVMLEAICSSLLDYLMMGLVFARFSAPSKRSLSLRFSGAMTLARTPQGLWCLAFRVANMRKHIMIKPEVQVLLAEPDNPGQSAFVFQQLVLQDAVSGMANLKLGLAATLVHIIGPESPLWGRSLASLVAGGAEVMVFLDGVDAMTSNNIQARHSYFPGDMRLNHRFATLYMMHKGQRLGLDFSEFDHTVTAGPPLHQPLLAASTFAELSACSLEQLMEQQPIPAKPPQQQQQQQQQEQEGVAERVVSPEVLQAAAKELASGGSCEEPSSRRKQGVEEGQKALVAQAAAAAAGGGPGPCGRNHSGSSGEPHPHQRADARQRSSRPDCPSPLGATACSSENSSSPPAAARTQQTQDDSSSQLSSSSSWTIQAASPQLLSAVAAEGASLDKMGSGLPGEPQPPGGN